MGMHCIYGPAHLHGNDQKVDFEAHGEGREVCGADVRVAGERAVVWNSRWRI